MKFTNLLLCTSLILSISTPCFAKEYDTEMENALASVKTRLNIGDFDNFKSEYRTNDDNEREYYFDWETNDEENYEYISAVYCDGIIVGYDHSFKGEYDADIKISEMSAADAKSVAKEFIKQANPDIYQNIEIIENDFNELGGSSYYFNLIRTENGVPVIGSGGNISVSKTTNKVRYFHINYDADIEFSEIENIISEEEGMKAYSEKLAPVLQYAYNYDYTKKELSVYPRFALEISDRLINAKDGSIYEVPKYDYVFGAAGGGSQNLKTEASKDSEERSFSEAELSELEKISGLMSEKDAEKAARENKIINLDPELKVSNIRLIRDYINAEKYSYSIRFENKSEEKYDYANVSLDAKTGEVLSFYKNGDYTKKDAQNKDTELKKADEALKAFVGDKYLEFKLIEDSAKGSVSYVRIHNGTEVSGNGASFSFDGNDDLVSYNLSYIDIMEFPSLEGALTSEEAFYKATEAVDFKLAYSVDYEKKIATPVYCFIENDRVTTFNQNAFSGELIDYKGEALKEDGKIEYSDIENHYAKDKFLKLAEFGIGFDEEELKPQQAITQAEYLTLLNKVFGYGTDIEEIYRRSFNAGIITKEQREDDSPVTRENAAIFMIKEMGADEYAKYDEIFAMPFSDVTENKGYIGILKAFGVVSGDGTGKFNPKNTISRGEALIMIYNYLDR